MTRAYFRHKAGVSQSARKVAPDNGTWWVDYRDARGKRKQERTTALRQAEAERLAHELAARADRLRKGLELPGPAPITFGAVAKLYRVAIAGLESYKDIDAQLRLYLEPVLGAKYMSEITPADCEACIARYRDVLAPASLRGLQIRIGAVYRWASRKARLYRGDNPIHDTTRVAVPERTPRVLSLEQLEQFFAASDVHDRVVYLFAVFTGLRKGEVAGLLWSMVDLGRAVIIVRYSYSKPRTKGRKDRLVPIHPELLPVLARMQAFATTPWVFPSPDGTMRSSEWDAAENFRVALRRAELVSGYLYRCVSRGRRKSCGHREERPVKAPARCPQCGMKLWAVGIPLEFTFKDLRSTFATHLAERGDLRLVQRLLGHSQLETTEKSYAAARLEWLRKGVGGLQLVRDTDGTRMRSEAVEAQPAVKQRGVK